MKTNNLYFGILLGAAAPLLAFLLTYFNIAIMEPENKKLSLYIIAALINLLLVRYYYRNELSDSARGVILVTFIGMIATLLLGNVNLEG